MTNISRSLVYSQAHCISKIYTFLEFINSFRKTEKQWESWEIKKSVNCWDSARVTRSQRASLPYWCRVPTRRLSWSPCSWRRKCCCCHRSAAYGSGNWFLTTPAPPDLRTNRQEDLNRWDVPVGFLQTQMESTGTLRLSRADSCGKHGATLQAG